MEDKRKQWKWEEVQPYMGLIMKTYHIIYRKFYPLYVGKEEDLQMDLMILLLECLPRIKAGKVKSVKNYMITVFKIHIYRQAAILIDQKQRELYLEDIGTDGEEDLSWEDIIAGTIIDSDDIYSRFTEEELPIALHLTGNGVGRNKLMKQEGIGRYKYERLKKLVLEKFESIIELKQATG